MRASEDFVCKACRGVPVDVDAPDARTMLNDLHEALYDESCPAKPHSPSVEWVALLGEVRRLRQEKWDLWNCYGMVQS